MLRDQLRAIIAHWLDQGLAAKGWGNTKLAEVAEISRETIWAIRKQEQDTTDETLTALAGALELPLPTLTVQDEQGQADYQMGVRDALRAVRAKIKEVEATPPTSGGNGDGGHARNAAQAHQQNQGVQKPRPKRRRSG